MSIPSRPSAPVTTRAARFASRAEGALKRYRVMAWITGVMLLLLCVEMLLRYGVGMSEERLGVFTLVPFVHGWIYVVYLATVLDLWSVMRWRWSRLITLVLAGVVPVLSFVVERRVHAEGEARLAAVRDAATDPAPVGGTLDPATDRATGGDGRPTTLGA
ncbi:DUF3817 domain-containing protein [Cellulomonas marina]|uniref:Integral membrane protein n=1 Tax=Cellulomonas marina TaxID=988821 RepID=A0A1I1A1W5_9CELL|nr:DUF3817 domain-containing protein [Cellulomonas marina]GIG30284.1 hypothetical protein Cma02nite_28840 [Cellulomonas marina]SFB31286.1 integral membrane protein [Cellulomonas marina]